MLKLYHHQSLTLSIFELLLLLSIKSTIERYKKAYANTSNSSCTIDTNSQFAAKWTMKMFTLRHLMGESLSSLSVKELKQLENRLERGITRIRSKKEVELQNDNIYLRAKVTSAEEL
ncbi:hypothetical protein BHE74_00007231 [Ensete ventricosum]|nr:hypothetical protein BHE74_00007231 [Ensete ventricosum]